MGNAIFTKLVKSPMLLVQSTCRGVLGTHTEVNNLWTTLYVYVILCKKPGGLFNKRSQTAVARAMIANRICDVASYSRNKSHVRQSQN